MIQRLLDKGDEHVVTEVHRALNGRFLLFSLHVYGCRIVQKLLEAATSTIRESIATELEPFTLFCIGDQNANHVLQKCVEVVQPSDGIGGILTQIADEALQLARHSFGCRLVQRLLQHSTLTDVREQVIVAILSDLLDLTKDQYGNYVVQHLVQYGPAEAR